MTTYRQRVCTSSLEISRNNQAVLYQAPNIAYVLIPQLVDPLVLCPIPAHPVPEAFDECVPEDDPCLLDLLRWTELLTAYAVLEVHDLHTRNRHLHRVVLRQQKLLKALIVPLPIALTLQFDVDEFVLDEGQVEVQRQNESLVLFWDFGDEVVQVGVAMKVPVVIEEPPIYAVFAKEAFNLAHLPPHFLQDYVYHLYPVEHAQFRIVCLFFFSDERPGDFVDNLLCVFTMAQFGAGCLLVISNADVVGELLTPIVLVNEPFAILHAQFEISEQLDQPILIQSLLLPEEVVENARPYCHYIEEEDLERTDQMSPHPPVPLRLEHAAVLPQQPQLVPQVQSTNVVGELVEANWYVC